MFIFKVRLLNILYFCCIIQLILSNQLSADDNSNYRIKNHIIYNEENKSLNDNYFPIVLYLNTAFDATQVKKAFSQDEYLKKHKIVLRRILHPITSINRDGGFKKFFADEFASERALPNYTLHLFGGGFDYRMLAEWYDSNGFFFPYFFSLITLYAGRLGNEAVESTNRNIYSHDHIADLYFFDIVGSILFMNDSVAKYFYNDLNMRNWSGQPMYNPGNSHIFNASTNYVISPYIYEKKIRFFFIMGMHYLGGLSFYVKDNYYITTALGFAVKNPFGSRSMHHFRNDNKSLQSQFSKLRFAGGIYIDKKNTLLTSIIFNGAENFKVKLNIYPELFRIDPINFGLLVALDGRNRPAFGININMPLGIGFFHM